MPAGPHQVTVIPDRAGCRALWSKAGLSDPVVRHVETVEALASRIAARVDGVDPRIVQAGALLHDVGRAFTHGPDHVPRGVAFLEEEGLDEEVVSCVACHMGAGITAKEADAFGWPPGRRYMPESLEEKIVCHADNLTFGDRYGPLEDVVTKLRSQGLDDGIPRMRALHAEIEGLVKVDLDDFLA